MECDMTNSDSASYASNQANFASSQCSNLTEPASDGMDVDETPQVQSTNASDGPYEIVREPGKPHLIAGLKFKDDNYEEEEAEMSSDSDDDEDEEESEEVSMNVSAAVLLNRTIEENEDEDDEDYVPTE